jgi:hypothetical protein
MSKQDLDLSTKNFAIKPADSAFRPGDCRHARRSIVHFSVSVLRLIRPVYGDVADRADRRSAVAPTALLSIIALMVMARRGRRRAKRQCSGVSSASEQYCVRLSAKSDHRHCRLLRSPVSSYATACC